MSMIGNFYLVDDERLRSILAAPTSVHEVVDAAYEEGNGRFLDVDKAWHCLHYLLTGREDGGAPPLNFIASGGTEVGGEDVGYGPARAFFSADVAVIADALRPLGHSDLVQSFDGRRMDDLAIYPDAGRWSEVDPTSEDGFGYYLGRFDDLKTLVERAKAQGLGLLAWLS